MKLQYFFMMVLGSGVAVAQSNTDAQAGAPEEIIVTATRKEESLARVPMSVQALDAEALDRLTVREIDDVARLTPGLVLNYQNAGTGGSTVAIRGISSDAGSATTGIYIDDVPIQVRSLGYSSGTVFPVIFDLDRVEVLRGPQGTLFGAGSEGGTVRFIQPKPSLDDYELYGRGELSSTQDGSENYEFGAAVGGPLIVDRLAFRASAYFRHDGGWIDRVIGDVTVQDPTGALHERSTTYTATDKYAENSNWQNSTALRAALLAQLSDDFSATVSVNYQDQKLHDLSSKFWLSASDPANDDYALPVFLQASPTATNNLTDMTIPTLDEGDSEFYLPQLQLEWHPEGLSVYSTTSYLHSDKTQWLDATPGYASIYAGLFYPPAGWKSASDYQDRLETYTQEVRMQSDRPAAVFSWLVGAFYSHAEQISQQRVHSNFFHAIDSWFGIPNLAGADPFGPGSSNYQNIWGTDLEPNSVNYNVRMTSVDEQVAAFGQLNFKATERLTLTLGARVSQNEFRFKGVFSAPENNLNAPFGSPCASGNCVYGDPDGEFAPVFPGGAASNKETAFTPKLTAAFQADAANLFYATISKGFRPGGGQVQLPTQCAADLQTFGYVDANGAAFTPTTFKSDSVWNYEVGAKNKLFDGKLQLDVSGYVIKWQDTQANLYMPTCGYNLTANLADATAQGIDLSVQTRPLQDLMIGLNVAYNETAFDAAVQSSDGTVIYSDSSAVPQSGAPWTVVTQAQYTSEIAGRRVYGHADYTYNSEFRRTGETDAQSILYQPLFAPQPETHQANLKIGTYLGDVDLALFVNNVFDAHPKLNYANRYTGAVNWTAYTFRPRTVGLTFSLRR